MGLGEIIAVLSLFVFLPWIVFAGIAKIKAAGSASLPPGRGSSEIRKSDLEALIATSVADATAPLLRRVEVLEALLTGEDEALDRIDPAVLSGVIEPSAEEHRPWAATDRVRV